MIVPRLSFVIPEALLLFSVVFGPLAFGGVEPWARLILQTAILLLFVSAAVRDSRTLPGTSRAVLTVVLGLVALGLLQVANPRPWSHPSSPFPFTASVEATRNDLPLYISYAALLWSAPRVLETREAQERFAWTLFFLGVVIAIIGIAQRGQGNLSYYGLRPVRHGLPFGPYVNRAHAASMMVMAALVGSGLMLSRWFDLREAPAFSRAELVSSQIVGLFLLGIVFFAIGSSSRGAFNSMLVSVGLAAFLATWFAGRSRRFLFRAVLGGCALSYVVFLCLQPSWIGNVFRAPDLSTSIRLAMYRGGFLLLRDFPLWGVGLGAVQAVFPHYQEPLVTGVVDHVHSDWLELALQFGLAGWGAVVVVLSIVTMKIVQAWLRMSSPRSRCLIGGILAAVFAFLLHETVEFSFHIPANAVIFLCLVSCLSAATVAAPSAER